MPCHARRLKAYGIPAWLRPPLNVALGWLANIDNAPLHLAAFERQDVSTTSAVLQSELTTLYKRSAVRQLLMVLGSTDALGNPVRPADPAFAS